MFPSSPKREVILACSGGWHCTTKSAEGKWRIWAWAASSNELPGEPPASSPPADAVGAAFPATHRSTGDCEHDDGLSPGLAWERKRRVQSSWMSCQTRLRQTRWEGIPTMGSTGANNAPQRSLTDESGTKPIRTNEETKAVKPGNSLKRADKESEVRVLYCMFKLLSTDHNCSSYFLQFPLPVCNFLKHALDESRSSASWAYDTHITKSFSIETTMVNNISFEGGIR